MNCSSVINPSLGYHDLLSYLNVTVAALGDKGDTDREKVIWLAIYAELQATGLILYIDHGQTPLQDISSAVVAIFSI